MTHCDEGEIFENTIAKNEICNIIVLVQRSTHAALPAFRATAWRFAPTEDAPLRKGQEMAQEMVHEMGLI